MDQENVMYDFGFFDDLTSEDYNRVSTILNSKPSKNGKKNQFSWLSSSSDKSKASADSQFCSPSHERDPAAEGSEHENDSFMSADTLQETIVEPVHNMTMSNAEAQTEAEMAPDREDEPTPTTTYHFQQQQPHLGLHHQNHFLPMPYPMAHLVSYAGGSVPMHHNQVPIMSHPGMHPYPVTPYMGMTGYFPGTHQIPIHMAAALPPPQNQLVTGDLNVFNAAQGMHISMASVTALGEYAHPHHHMLSAHTVEQTIGASGPEFAMPHGIPYNASGMPIPYPGNFSLHNNTLVDNSNDMSVQAKQRRNKKKRPPGYYDQVNEPEAALQYMGEQNSTAYANNLGDGSNDKRDADCISPSSSSEVTSSEHSSYSHTHSGTSAEETSGRHEGVENTDIFTNRHQAVPVHVHTTQLDSESSLSTSNTQEVSHTNVTVDKVPIEDTNSSSDQCYLPVSPHSSEVETVPEAAVVVNDDVPTVELPAVAVNFEVHLDNTEEEITTEATVQCYVGDATSSPVIDIVSDSVTEMTSSTSSNDCATAYDESSKVETLKPVACTPVPKKPSSWADLLRNTKQAQNSIVIKSYTDQVYKPIVSKQPTPAESTAKSSSSTVEGDVTAPDVCSVCEDPYSEKLKEIVCHHELLHKGISITPRGVKNKKNCCYISATLQALTACPALYHLLKAIAASVPENRGPTCTPIIDALAKFVSEFQYLPFSKMPDSKSPAVRKDIPPGLTIEPGYIYAMLKLPKYAKVFMSGRQEDAEEFLSCMLNGLHDEFVAVTHSKNTESTANGSTSLPEPVDQDEAGWEQVGPRNKSMITRVATTERSPIVEIFQGRIRSVLHQMNSRDSASLQPFFTLQLDIQSDKVHSVRDALEEMVKKETLQDFTCSRTKVEVEASRRTFLDVLPPVLILHLKYFLYDKTGGCQKLNKAVEFGMDLEINKDILTPTKTRYNYDERRYKLFAVVNHHGPRAIGGHYTAHIYQHGCSGWLHIDDEDIRPVPTDSVTKYTPPRVPYLLFYRQAKYL